MIAYCNDAVNLTELFVPSFSFALDGLTTSPVGTGGPTMTDTLPVTPPDAAEILTVPSLRAVTRPLESTVASVRSEADHVTAVNPFELPSEKVPVAVH